MGFSLLMCCYIGVYADASSQVEGSQNNNLPMSIDSLNQVNSTKANPPKSHVSTNPIDVGVILPAPQLIQRISQGRMLLEWKPIAEATNYTLFWNTKGNVSTSDNKLVLARSPLQLINLMPGLTYYYRISALSSAGESALSTEITVTAPPSASIINVLKIAKKSIKMAWENTPGATIYNLYWNTNGGVTNSDNKMVDVKSPMDHANLVSGLTYFYKIGAENSGGETLSSELSATLVPSVPTIITSTPGNKSVLIEWKNVAGARFYRLYWSDTDSAEQNVNTIEAVVSPYVHADLANGKTYSYKLVAENTAGKSDLSLESIVTLIPNSPALSSIKKNSAQIELHWSNSAGALSYNLYWRIAGKESQPFVKVENVKSPYMHQKLTNGQTYLYSVSAINSAGESELNEMAVILAPNPPTIANVLGSHHQILLNWDTSLGAETYNIYWNNLGDVSNKDNVITSHQKSILHEGLINGLTYYYRLSAVNSGGESRLSDEIKTVLAPDVPTPETPKSMHKAIELAWDEVKGALSYNIYWNSTGKVSTNDSKIENTVSPYTHHQLNSGATYYYLVSAVNAGGENVSEQIESTLVPDSPSGIDSRYEKTEASLMWNNAIGAAYYSIYWNITGNVTSQDQKIDNVSSPTIFRDLTKGATYYYKITASNVAGESALSQQTVITIAPEVPQFTFLVGGFKITDLAWAPVFGATNYHLYWNNSALDIDNSNKISDIKSPFKHSELTNGKSYHYIVSASNAGGESFSEPTIITLTPDTPEFSSIIGKNNTAILNWKKMMGATGYNIYWSKKEITASDNEKIVISEALSRYQHTELINGKKYFYKISATNIGGESTLSSMQYVFLPPDPPTQLMSEIGDRTISISWSAVENADTYTVYWNTRAGVDTYDNHIENAKSPYVFKGLKNRMKYYFIVTAMNQGGEGIPSPEIVASSHNISLANLFLDEKLKQCVNDTAAENGWNYADEFIGALSCYNSAIVDLTDIHYLVNLNSLSLNANNISNLKPLRGLNKLTFLSLSSNQIKELTPLSKLKNLVYLALYDNQIENIDALATLNNLTSLYLNSNRIQNVKSLALLTRLNVLDLAGNLIGSQEGGEVDTLHTLKNASAIQLDGNSGMSCTALKLLLDALGSPPVDLDGVSTNYDVVDAGINCTQSLTEANSN